MDLEIAPRRQHYYFAHEYIRERAQYNPRPFVASLRKESGTRYLSFLWVAQGLVAKREEDEFIPADGLECFPVEIGEYYSALVKFPTPVRITEAYFAAILLRVYETSSVLHSFFTLELSTKDDRSLTTVLGRWEGVSHLNLGTGPPPDKEGFLEAITKLALN